MQLGIGQPVTAAAFLADGGSGARFVHAAAQLQAQLFKAAMRYQIETLAFLKHRCERDVKLIDDLVASGEFEDAFDVVGAFVRNAATEYADEAGKFASIGSKLASEAARRLRKETDGAIQDIAAQTAA